MLPEHGHIHISDGALFILFLMVALVVVLAVAIIRHIFSDRADARAQARLLANERASRVYTVTGRDTAPITPKAYAQYSSTTTTPQPYMEPVMSAMQSGTPMAPTWQRRMADMEGSSVHHHHHSDHSGSDMLMGGMAGMMLGEALSDRHESRVVEVPEPVSSPDVFAGSGTSASDDSGITIDTSSSDTSSYSGGSDYGGGSSDFGGSSDSGGVDISW